MKKNVMILLIFTILVACKKEYTPRESVTISIEKFKMDSTSIRAIEIVNDSSVVYAGSNGDLGIITSSGKLIATKKIITDTIIPHFRALAYTKKAVFALNVGNPALLYKYENNKIDIVHFSHHRTVKWRFCSFSLKNIAYFE